MYLRSYKWCGASAVARMPVGPNPWIEIHPERDSCFKNDSDLLLEAEIFPANHSPHAACNVVLANSVIKIS